MGQTIKRFGTKEKIMFSNKGVNDRALVIIDWQSHPKGVTTLLRASITIFASPSKMEGLQLWEAVVEMARRAAWSSTLA